MLWDIIGEDNSFAGLISKPGVTWAELLDHDNIITEFRNQNKQLLEQYAESQHSVNAHPQVFPEMLEYVVSMPSETDSPLRKFKLPYISGEVLAIQSNLIYEAFFGIEDDSGDEEESKAEPTHSNLHKLLGYFKQAELNPLLAGYCEKVYNNLFHRRRNQLVQFVFDGYCEALLQHASNCNVASMLRKILTIERDEKDKQTFRELRERLLQHLLDLYHLRDTAYKQNVVAILIELTTRRLLIADGSELFQLVLNNPQTYLDPTCIGIDEQSCRFLRALLVKCNTKQAVEEDEDNNIHLHESFLEKMGGWLLHSSNFLQGAASDKLSNQLHKEVVLLGTTRLSLVECIRQAVKMQNANLNKKLTSGSLLQLLLELCLRHRFNGILHSMYRGIVLELLKQQSVRSAIAEEILDAIMINFLVEDNKLILGHFTDIFLAIEGYADPAIVAKLQMPDILTFYQDHILPRKQKKEFKWAGNIENLHAGPHNFIDDEPGATNASAPTASKPSWSENPPAEQPEEEKPQEPIDQFNSFAQGKTKEFNPFAAFAAESKPKPADFSAFEDFSM